MVLEVEGLSFSYPEKEELLKEIYIQIKEGEFWVLCGPSGCGKTTFLRCLKPEIAPHGIKRGRITKRGPAEIGYVFQNPDSQIVTDTVRHELAFGLENMGLETEVIRRRVAETALFFGIDEWIDASVHTISGGQKQLLNLASVIAMRPKLLLLDEPTSQLDPVARKTFLELLVRINRELGIAVIVSEHHLEEVLSLADCVLFMKQGTFVFKGSPKEYAAFITQKEEKQKRSLPASVRIAEALGIIGETIPFTVREGRDAISNYIKRQGSLPKEKLLSFQIPERKKREDVRKCLRVEHLWFQYQKQSPFVLKGLNLEIERGIFHAIVGGNGSGKSTLLYVLGKRLKANRGKIRLGEDKKMPKIGLLMQNPKSMFSFDTVEEELREVECKDMLVERLKLAALIKQHPYDLSGGEQQRLGLAMVLAKEPDLLLLDEPTKGLDSSFKEELAEHLRRYVKEGHTILCVTHDVEFAASYSDVCSILFEGEILATQNTKDFFMDNAFYTTDAERILRGFDGVQQVQKLM